MWLDVDGHRYQNGTTATMIFGVAHIVSLPLAASCRLQPGDVISTGTPPGVGLGQKPPVYLKGGEVMRLGIEGLGEQTQKGHPHMTKITGLRTIDVRFPTSQHLDGSDAMNPDPDYSAAYVILETDRPAGRPRPDLHHRPRQRDLPWPPSRRCGIWSSGSTWPGFPPTWAASGVM